MKNIEIGEKDLSPEELEKMLKAFREQPLKFVNDTESWINQLEVKIKKTDKNAVIPTYAKPGDAGLDLTAVSKKYEDGLLVYDTGLAFEIPLGYVGLVFPRSSISKTALTLSNSVGVIDSGYRGSVTFKFIQNFNFPEPIYKVGDRIGQLIIMPYPTIKLIEVDELSESERGEGGYGHSGK